MNKPLENISAINETVNIGNIKSDRNFDNNTNDWCGGQNILILTQDSKDEEDSNGQQNLTLAVDLYCS